MSTNIGMGECCMSGVVHSGTPAGRVETIGDVPAYVSEPESKSKSQTLVFITDIFGYELPNVRLLADQYAKNGFYVYVPDVLFGDPLPIDFLQSVEPPLKDQRQAGLIDKAKNMATVTTTLPPWLLKHTEAKTRPVVEKFIKDVRAIPGTGKVGTVGFCFGGRYAVLTAHGVADAAYACHPSLLAVTGDFEDVSKPLAIAVGDHDSLLDTKSIDQIKEFLAKKSVPTEVVVYEEQVHGFTLRGDFSYDKDKKAMDDALAQGVKFLKAHLS